MFFSFTANSTSSVPSSCSIKSGATASAQADLDKYAGCSTIVGDLVLTGDMASAALAGVQEIDGSLTVKNATSLTQFSADSLQKISDTLTLQELTVLNTASFGSLAEVDTIQFVTLPAVSSIITKLTSAKQITITDTALESIAGFEELDEVEVFNVNNNKGLATIKSKLKHVTNALEVTFNGQSADISFDDLEWANNITLRDVSSASFASLSSVNESLGFINNSISSIDLSTLQKIGGSLSIVSNDELTSLNFDNLTSVGGGFVIANNSKLAKIDTFGDLTTIGGAMVVTGKFGDLGFNSLKSVKGGAEVESTSSNFSCDALNKLQKKGGIQGDSFVCKDGATSTSVKLTATSKSDDDSTSTADSSSGSASATSTSKTSKSKGAAAANFNAPGSSLMGAVAAVAYALL